MAITSEGTVTLRNDMVEEIRRRAKNLDGIEIRFGIPAPAGEHQDPDRAVTTQLTTAAVLMFVEFGMGPGDRAERPVIRHVAAANREEMTRGFILAAETALHARDPVPIAKGLGAELARLTRDRLEAVGAVDTGQTLQAIDAVVKRETD